MPDDQQKPADATLDALVEEAQKRFKLCEAAEKEAREKSLDDLKFRAGEQWSPGVRAQRDQDGMPCLTLNVLPARERQILNDQRQNRQAMKVSPVDDKADPDTAEIIQGIIRHIEYDSNADIAYDTAFASAVRAGFGYFRIVTEYESPDSNLQVIKVKRVRNPFNVYLDPNSQEPDGSDAEYGFIFSWLTKEEYKREFPDDELSSLEDWSSVGDRAPGWIQEDGAIRIAEYFYKEYQTREVGQGENKRTAKIPQVKWAKINGIKTLEETDWPAPWIPIVPVLGDELDVDGHRILEGMVRHAKDPQKMVNYAASGVIQAIATAPKPPYLAHVGQTEEFPEWKELNKKIVPVLRWKQVSVGGNPVGEPKRVDGGTDIAALSQAWMQFTDELKAVTGIYDAQLGARSNEKSGTAILQRKQQGEISNFHYIDNLTRAIRHGGRIIIALIPHIYSEPRVMRIIGEDGSHDTVQVNKEFAEKQGAIKKLYDLTVGRYDVTVSSGPSYQTKRQEAADSMIKLVNAYPQLMQFAGDLMVNNFDWPGHEDLAERLRKMLPPQLQDEAEDIPPQAQAAIAQGKQQLMALNEYAKQQEALVNQLQREKEAKILDNQVKLTIAEKEIEAKIAIAEISTKAQVISERAQMYQEIWRELHGASHESALAAQQHQQTMEQAQQGHEQALEQGDQTAQNTMAQQAQQAQLQPQNGSDNA